MSGDAADRHALRRRLRGARAAYAATPQARADTQQVVGRLRTLLGRVTTTELAVASYVAGVDEIDPGAATSDLDLVFLPRIDRDVKGQMSFVGWRRGDALEPNRFGVLEPVLVGRHPEPAVVAPNELGLVFVPVIGVDATGRRIGSGAGYYDRAFAFRRTRAAPPLLVAVAYDLQLVDEVPAQPWDVDVDVVVTPTRTIFTR